MSRILIAALIASGMGVGSAAADAIVVYDAQLGDKFEAKREIVDRVQREYGPTTVYDSGQKIPESVARDLIAGQKLPESAGTAAVPAELKGTLPHTEPDTRWVRLGEHLLELRPDGNIVMGVYDVLPVS